MQQMKRKCYYHEKKTTDNKDKRSIERHETNLTGQTRHGEETCQNSKVQERFWKRGGGGEV